MIEGSAEDVTQNLSSQQGAVTPPKPHPLAAGGLRPAGGGETHHSFLAGRILNPCFLLTVSDER